MADCNDAQCTLGSIDPIDDPEAAHSVLPETRKVPDQRRANLRIPRERTDRLFDAVLHVRRKTANDLGNVGRNVRG